MDERLKVLKDGTIRSLLTKILNVGGELTPDIRPKLDLEYGLEEVEGASEDKLRTLERMVEAGILHKRFYTRIMKCPFCGSKHILAKCHCSKCGSVNILKMFLLEHVQCGGKAEEREFKKVKGLCPLCGVKVKENEVKKIGSWFECVKCGQGFYEPALTYSCADCQGRFTLKEVELETVYSYEVDEKVESELKRVTDVMDPLRKALPEEYVIEAPGALTGSSGVEHKFDMIVYRRGGEARKTAIDVAVSNSLIKEEKIAKMFVKIMDTKPSRSILVAVPGITGVGKRLASLYKIELIEGKDVSQAADKLREAFKPS